MSAQFWDVLEDGGVLHKVDTADLTIGQRVLLTRPNGAAFAATVKSIDVDGTVTLQQWDDCGWLGEPT